MVESKIIEGKEEAGAKFADYFDYSEKIGTIPSHRALAMLRGRREEILHVATCAWIPKRKNQNRMRRITLAKHTWPRTLASGIRTGPLMHG